MDGMGTSRFRQEKHEEHEVGTAMSGDGRSKFLPSSAFMFLLSKIPFIPLFHQNSVAESKQAEANLLKILKIRFF
jgi:hypothetical protein